MKDKIKNKINQENNKRNNNPKNMDQIEKKIKCWEVKLENKINFKKH